MLLEVGCDEDKEGGGGRNAEAVVARSKGPFVVRKQSYVGGTGGGGIEDAAAAAKIAAAEIGRDTITPPGTLPFWC